MRTSKAWSDCTSTECYFSGTWAQSIFGQHWGKKRAAWALLTHGAGRTSPLFILCIEGCSLVRSLPSLSQPLRKWSVLKKAQLWEVFSSSEIIKKANRTAGCSAVCVTCLSSSVHRAEPGVSPSCPSKPCYLLKGGGTTVHGFPCQLMSPHAHILISAPELCFFQCKEQQWQGPKAKIWP